MIKRLLSTAAAVAFVAVSSWMAFQGEASAQDKKKLVFLSWNAPQNAPMFQRWIDAFEKRHPDVQIELLDKTGSEWATFYQTQLVAGTAPDIIDIQGFLWVEYASDDGLVDLKPYLDAHPEARDRYNQDVLKFWEYKGGQYGLPYYINKTFLYYNKKLFDEAGLSGPPKTFDELLADAKKIGDLRPETSGFITLNFDWLYWPLFAANGIEFLNEDMTKAAFNTPQAAETIKKLAEATQGDAVNKIAWTGRWAEPNSAFASGNVGMYNAHGGAYYNFRGQAKWLNQDTLGIADFPGGWGAMGSNHGLAVSASTKYPDLASEFVAMATNDEWATVTSQRITRITGNKAADEALMQHLKDEDPLGLEIQKTMLANPDKIAGGWKTPLDTRLKEAFWPEIQAALLGQKDPQEALDEAESKVNRVLERGR